MAQVLVSEDLEPVKRGHTARKDKDELGKEWSKFSTPSRANGWRKPDQYCLPEGKLVSLLQRHQLPYTIQGSNFIFKTNDIRSLQSRLNVDSSCEKCLPRFEIDFDDMSALLKEFHATLLGTNLKFKSNENMLGFAHEFARRYGIPHTICWLQEKYPVFICEVAHAIPLVPAFKAIVRENLHDIRLMLDITQRVLEAYTESEASFDTFELKTDYSLVEFTCYKEMSHVRSGPNLDFNRSLPRCWFNSDNLGLANETQLRRLFAIPFQLQDLLTHVITCGFPKGALFLRCKSESRMSLPGGGMEYRYLRNVCQSVRVTHVRKL